MIGTNSWTGAALDRMREEFVDNQASHGDVVFMLMIFYRNFIAVDLAQKEFERSILQGWRVTHTI